MANNKKNSPTQQKKAIITGINIPFSKKEILGFGMIRTCLGAKNPWIETYLLFSIDIYILVNSIYYTS